MKIIYELVVQKECETWLLDQIDEYQVKLLNQSENDNKSIRTKLSTMFEWQIRKDYQEWLSDQLDENKKSMVAKMWTLFEWQINTIL